MVRWVYAGVGGVSDIKGCPLERGVCKMKKETMVLALFFLVTSCGSGSVNKYHSSPLQENSASEPIAAPTKSTIPSLSPRTASPKA